MTYSFSVKDHCPHPLHLPSTCPTSPALSSISSSGDSHNNDDDSICIPCTSAVIGLKDAHRFVANGQKVLQEWNRQWGTTSSFLFRAVNTFHEFGFVKMPADKAREELMATIQKGREALLQLESIAFIDPHSIQDDSPNFWLGLIRIVEGLTERISHTDAVLQLCSYIHACLS
jgi:hypothetical protein